MGDKIKLVDANIVKQRIIETLSNQYPQALIESVINEVLEEIPEVDAEPIKYGHWFFTEYEFFTCSECGKDYYQGADSSEEARKKLRTGEFHSRCPHCGAYMSGGDVHGK